jgi:hypothetical protein
MSPFDMEETIKRICIKNNIDYKVKIEWSIHMMRCNYKDKTISFNPDRCTSMAKKLNMTMKRFMEFATYHEIGHCLDYENETSSKNIIEREIAAWTLSRSLVSYDLLEEYDQFNEINLASYKNRYQKN